MEVKKISVLLTAGLCAWMLGGCGGGYIQTINEMQVLVVKATQIAEATYPGVEFLEADGTVPGGQGMKAQDVTQWRFVYRYKHDEITECVFVRYDNGGWTDPELVHDVFLESDPISLPLGSSLVEGIKRLRSAGYSSPFQLVTLRRPVSPDPKVRAEAWYIFKVVAAGLYVFVGVETGSIWTVPISS